MSDYAPTAIRRAITELLQGEIGEIRKPLQGVFKYGTFSGQPLPAEQAHALQDHFGTHWFGMRFGRHRPSPASPSSAMGSHRHVEVPITVDVTTHLASTVEEDERDSVADAVQGDLELAGQALGMPGNLLADSESNATGIVDGCALREPEVSEPQFDWEQQLARTRIEATFLVTIGQEV